VPLIPSPGLTASGLIRRSASASAPAPRPVRGLRRVLTAAATIASQKMRSTAPGTGKRWQADAWRAYDNVGEIHYSASFFGHCLARVRLVVQERGPDGEWVEVDSPEATEALRGLESETGALAELQRCYGEQQFVVGESILFGRMVDGVETWTMVSVDEVEIKGGKITHKPGGPLPEVEYGDRSAEGGTLAAGQAVAYRLWNGHPRRSGEADSPLRAVLPLCEELILMGRAVRSRARNRASGPGILFVHDSITEPAAADPGMDEDAEQQDPVVADLIATMNEARTDEDSAAASVPLVFRLDPPDGTAIKDSVHLLQLTDPALAYPETDRETQVIRRIGHGLNLPVEVITGMADANHWSAWLIDESIWTQHLQSPVERLCADLTRIRLEPAERERRRIWHDPSDLVVKPDRYADALQAHDRLVISDEALREAGGFEENDAPDDAERERRRASTGGQPPAGPGTTETGPPAEAAVAGAIRVATARCREVAGARIRTRLQRGDVATGPETRTTPNDRLAAALGSEFVSALGLDPAALVSGGASCLAAAGYPRALVADVERRAAAGLFDRALPV
jgi:hypothetical protein